MQKPIPTCRDPWARWAKIILAIVVCATLLALAGCRPKEEIAPLPTPGTPVAPATRAMPPVLFVDNETGCHYLSSGGADAPLVPRLDRNGKQVCK